MPEALSVLWLPFLMCLVLTGIHAYLGIHVVMREVIFVDIALAQIAALGTTIALLMGYDIHDPQVYWIALASTLAGAGIFAVTRSRRRRIPQEAIIGLVYAGSAALGILLAEKLPHGLSHLKEILAGNIVTVTPYDVWHTAVLYAAIGAVHWFCRRPFFTISENPEIALERGWNVKGWDFLFYATFGIVVTSSVQIAGVLLVFAYLIAPAVMGMLLARGIRARLLIGWLTGAAASAIGIAFAYDRPAGPAVVCALVALLLPAAAWTRLRTPKKDTASS